MAMSNGYLIAAGNEVAAAHEISDGFGLDVIDVASIDDPDTAASALAAAANVGLVISAASVRDTKFVAVLRALAQHLERAQLILADAEARSALPFLPEAWPAMTLDEARSRSTALVRQRNEPPPAAPGDAAPMPASTPEPSSAGEHASPEGNEQAPAEGEAPAEANDIAEASTGESEPPRSEPETAQLDWPPFDSAKPADVFLSFAWLERDREVALELANKLAANGLNVWVSHEHISPGAGSFEDQVKRQLDDSKLVIALWTEDARANAVVVDEAMRAHQRDKLISAVIDGSRPPVALPGGSHLSQEGAIDALANSVAERVRQLSGEQSAPSQISAAEPPSQPPAHDLSAPNDGPSFGGVSGVPSTLPQAQAPHEPTQEEIDAALRTDRDLPTVDIPLKRQPEAAAPPAAPAPQAPAPAMPKQQEARERGVAIEAARTGGGASVAATAPADATAFAPKKLRRQTPELMRIVIHQPKDLQAVIKRIRKQDRRAEPAASGAHMGEVPIGASIGVALEVRGAACDGTLQRRKWLGEPIDFPFTLEAEGGPKQATIIARVFLDDAQIGVMAFTRPISGPAKKAASDGERIRMKRPKRVFLSYSSKDREVVSAIATAYTAAGIPHFWDRRALKSGETWHPRLRREIDRADVFHLCWSKAAAQSEWVEKEAEHALQRNMRSKGKMPNITVQMLDGPPWAAHPRNLDAINFDDFVRAAIVGYARGDGSS